MFASSSFEITVNFVQSFCYPYLLFAMLNWVWSKKKCWNIQVKNFKLWSFCQPLVRFNVNLPGNDVDLTNDNNLCNCGHIVCQLLFYMKLVIRFTLIFTHFPTKWLRPKYVFIRCRWMSSDGISMAMHSCVFICFYLYFLTSWQFRLVSFSHSSESILPSHSYFNTCRLSNAKIA